MSKLFRTKGWMTIAQLTGAWGAPNLRKAEKIRSSVNRTSYIS